MKLRTFTAIAALLGASIMASQASATEAGGNLLTNGNFETGDFTGWTVTDQAGGSGSWFVGGSGAGTPLNGFSTPAALTGGGNFYAETDQPGPGSHTLSQSFFLSGNSATLSFDAYANDQSGAAPVGGSTDFTETPNQHFEIDIFKVGLPDPQVFYGTYADAWGLQSINLGPFLDGPGVYNLSFTEVDNQLFYNVGLDNISVTAGGVPEPAEWALMLVGFAGLGAALRARRQAAVAA